MYADNANLHLYSQVWCLWAYYGYVDTDNDDVRNTGANPNHDSPGQRQRQHRVDAQREEEEKCYLRGW